MFYIYEFPIILGFFLKIILLYFIILKINKVIFKIYNSKKDFYPNIFIMFNEIIQNFKFYFEIKIKILKLLIKFIL